MRVGIVGLGLIGGSIGLAARAGGMEVIGFDADPDVGRDSVKAGAADAAADSVEVLAGSVDLLVLAAPPAAILRLLPAVARSLRPGSVATDVGSVKAPVAALAETLLPDRFVPSHPMAGSERHGLEAARADLFWGATWAVTPLAASVPAAVERVESFVSMLGATPVFMTPEAHDRAVAVTSHAPHVLAYVLSALAKDREADGERLMALAAGGYHSATRVAASSPALWSDICLENRDEVLAALYELLAGISGAVRALEASDGAALEAILSRGHRSE